MNKFFLFTLCFVTIISCSKFPVQSDKEKQNLKGEVISTLILSYEAIDKFGEGILTKGKLNSFDSEYVVYDTLGNIQYSKGYYFKDIVKSFEEKYDTSGNVIEYISYNEDGKVSFHNKYVNDSLGNVLIELDDNNRKTVYHYDNNNNLVKESSRYWDVLYNYDETGKLVETGYDWKDGKKIEMHKYFYDSNNNKIRSEWKDTYTLYKYDDNDNLIETITYKKDLPKDIVESKSQYSFNKKGDMLKSINWNKDGEIEEETSFNYYYVDTNLISIIQMVPDDIINYVVNKSYQENNKLKSRVAYKIDAEIFNMLKYYYAKNLLTSRTYYSEYSEFQEIYTYDKDRLIEMKLIDGDSVSVIKYNKKSQPILITEFDKNNNPIRKTKFEYSGNFKKQTISQYTNDLKLNKESSKQSILIKGKLSELREIHNGIENSYILEYNTNGDIVKKENISTKEIYTYQYKYDSIGNWIEQTTIKNNTPISINERIIRYNND